MNLRKIVLKPVSHQDYAQLENLQGFGHHRAFGNPIGCLAQIATPLYWDNHTSLLEEAIDDPYFDQVTLRIPPGLDFSPLLRVCSVRKRGFYLDIYREKTKVFLDQIAEIADNHPRDFHYLEVKLKKGDRFAQTDRTIIGVRRIEGRIVTNEMIVPSTFSGEFSYEGNPLRGRHMCALYDLATKINLSRELQLT